VIVLDGSAVVDLLLDVRPQADRIRQEVLGGDLHAPHLLDVEVGQVLRRFVLAGALSEARARRAVEHLGWLPITRYPHHGFLERALGLLRNLTVYDAVYVALAEALDAPLLTRDAKLARAARHRVAVRLVR